MKQLPPLKLPVKKAGNKFSLMQRLNIRCLSRQSSLGLMTDKNKLDPVVVLSCIFMEDELAEKTVDSIVNKVGMFVVRMLSMHMINFIHLS